MSEGPTPATALDAAFVRDLRLLFEASPDVLLVLLPDSPRYTMVAATDVRLLATHTTREQTIGRSLFELFPDNPDDPSATGTNNLRASLERVRATRAADTMAVQRYDIRGPDGAFQPKYWSPKNIPVLSAEGEVLYILHRVEDVTELVQATELGEELRDKSRAMEREVIKRSQELATANRELREANTKLGQLDAAKTAFFSNVSHEFRTPLTLIMAPIEDALTQPSKVLDEAGLRTVHRSAVRLLRLVNTLLDFARIEAGRLNPSFVQTDLAALTADLASSFRSLIERAGLKLTVDCPALSEPVYVDPSHWEKIILNLLSNAFKFTLQGEIAVVLAARQGQVEVTIRDTGTGIPARELPHIFERFRRVQGAKGRTFEGTGIGLSLVNELVRLQGGSLRATSVEGQGSEFTLSLPLGKAHLSPESISESSSFLPTTAENPYLLEASRWLGASWQTDPGAAPAPHALPLPSEAEGKQPYRVLVVEDNRDMRDYLVRLLATRWHVDAADNGESALELVRHQPPNLVLSDVMMPIMDGLGLLHALRSDKKTSNIPVVLLSARAGEEAIIHGLDTGADDYLLKPFSARELLARVQTNLEMSRRRQEWAAELERANTELEAFSYSVSHDLRAPLRAIDGFSGMLLAEHGDQLDEQGRHYLSRVRASTRRMAHLIDDLLSLSRIARAPLRREATNLSELASTVLQELASAYPDRSVQWSVEPNMEAQADARLLRVVLDNLLGNAWKFTSKRADAKISVHSTQHDDARVYVVQDNGAGFDMDYAKKLFAPFQRLHSEAEFEGTGIGLATVQRIINRHSGRIWAESAPGQGATFLFTLGPVP
ncbi:MAG TPA: ATP-binding protein, partial [Polyangiaceae bacterium]|nr:ATP-binding protein [Polyangiaceae bacterium]